MFKARCIGEFDDTGYKMPQVGDVVTVIGEELDEGMRMYELAEFPPMMINDKLHRFTFEAAAFAPFDGPDERERLETWQEEHLSREDKLLMRIAENMPEEALEPGAFERIWKGIEAHLNRPL